MTLRCYEDEFRLLILRREAGAEAVGMLESLLADGDVPPSCREQARAIIQKFNGLQQSEKESE